MLQQKYLFLYALEMYLHFATKIFFHNRVLGKVASLAPFMICFYALPFLRSIPLGLPKGARNLNIGILTLEGSRLSTLGPHLENALSSL